MILLLHNVLANHIGSTVASANSAEYDSSKETGSCNCSSVQHTRKDDGALFHIYKLKYVYTAKKSAKLTIIRVTAVVDHC